jgi:hypothetical protein
MGWAPDSRGIAWIGGHLGNRTPSLTSPRRVFDLPRRAGEGTKGDRIAPQVTPAF